MAYVHCPECSFSRRHDPLFAPDECPRCRLRGRTVELERIQRLPRLEVERIFADEAGLGPGMRRTRAS
jgi:hypothetical protein